MKKTNMGPTALAVLIAMATGLAWTLFNWPALQSLHDKWTHLDEAYAVGYPAVILAVWWIARHWAVLRQRCQARSLAIALLLLVVVLLAGGAARLVQLMVLQQIAALVSLWLILVVALGWSVGRFLLFPFALLALGVPVWDFLIDPLRAMTVWFTQHLLDLLNIPAHVDGFLISLPAGIIEVAGGCSGLNLLLAMMLVGLMFAESHHLPRMRRVAIVLLAAVFGVLDNWLRVFLLVLIAHQTQMQSSLVYHHGSFGWWIFAINLLPYFWLASRIERRTSLASRSSRGHGAIKPVLPVGQMLGYAAFAAALTAVATLVTHSLEQRRGLAERGFAAPISAVEIVPGWFPRYSGQDVTQAWRARVGERDFDIITLTYLEQRVDKKLIYYSNRIAAENAEHPRGQLMVEPDFSVNVTLVNGGTQRLVWWFWWVDGATSTNPLKTKLLQLRAMLVGDPSAALIAVSTACHGDCENLVEQLRPSVVPLLASLRKMQVVR